jgi:hypothetical protein
MSAALDAAAQGWAGMENALASIWRRIIVGEGKSWVVFSHGTCVVFSDGDGDLTERALGIMRDWGPVHVGGAAGDFSVIALADEPGWVVTCHHPDILTYVSPDDLPPEPPEVQIGLFGRDRRHEDAQQLTIVHVEGHNG